MMAQIIDTKITPSRKRARTGTISESESSPQNDIHSSPHSANQGHDAKRVKLPVAVRWESGVTRFAADEDFVHEDNDAEDAAETPSRGNGAGLGKRVRSCWEVKSCLSSQEKLTRLSAGHHAAAEVIG